jgi:DNA polymerase III alpha subunit
VKAASSRASISSPTRTSASDYARVGLSIHDHPMRHLREGLSRRGVLRADDLRPLAHGAKVTVAGLVIGRQRPDTASGITFVTLEDETGLVNLIVRRDVFGENYAVARNATLMLGGHPRARAHARAARAAGRHGPARALARLPLTRRPQRGEGRRPFTRRRSASVKSSRMSSAVPSRPSAPAEMACTPASSQRMA